MHTATNGIAVCAVLDQKRVFIHSFSLPFASQAQQSILSNIDKDDGSDALVNAILVARGDALPTQFLDVKHCFADLLSDEQMDSLIEISKVVSQHLAQHHSSS